MDIVSLERSAFRLTEQDLEGWGAQLHSASFSCVQSYIASYALKLM